MTVPSNPLRVSAKLREIVIKFSAKLPTINHFELDPELLGMQVISPIATPLDSPEGNARGEMIHVQGSRASGKDTVAGPRVL